MVSNPRSTISDRTNFEFRIEDRKKRKPQRSKPLMGRVVSTLVALLLLAVVFRYLPPESGNAETRPTNASIPVMPGELSVAGLQVNEAPAGIYLDGIITNAGKSPVTGATAEVSFRDLQGNLVGVMQRPIAGLLQGRDDQTGGEFAAGPIKPNEIRPFHISMEQIPSDWNHQTPELRVVSVSVQ
jgi:hypothetical protein